MKAAQSRDLHRGRVLAAWSVAASLLLAVLNIAVGLQAGSTSVVAAGVEFAGDVLASAIVFAGMVIASRPADETHPYGHGRFEILAALLVGLILCSAGLTICVRSLQQIGEVRQAPAASGLAAPLIAGLVKAVLAATKFRVGRRIGSGALLADAWNDGIDILSSAAAFGALALTITDPTRFLEADSYGGFVVGMVVIVTGLRVVRDASMELTDTMPPPSLVEAIRRHAVRVDGVEGVEKCFARKTGLRYHVDIHIEVEPSMTVADSHWIAHQVQDQIVKGMPEIAGVLVHVEPKPGRTPLNR
jgi:cation diffusion facilitator family transporter